MMIQSTIKQSKCIEKVMTSVRHIKKDYHFWTNLHLEKYASILFNE